jgi:hypothetical protein
MNLIQPSAAQKPVADFDDRYLHQTQFEFMSVGERLRRINQRIKNFGNKNSHGGDESLERCTMLYFSVDAKHLTEARHLIISLCKDKLIFMRVKPVQHSTMMQVELFLKISIVQRVRELMKLRFHC